MSTYYSLWQLSEAARDQILVMATAMLVVQLACYPLVRRLFNTRYLSWAYIILTILIDLVIGIAVGGGIQ